MPDDDIQWDDEVQWDEESPDQFPGMPSPSMRNQAKAWQLPQVGNVDQLAEFQKSQEPPEPPPMLARPQGQRDPVDMEKVLRGNMAQAGSFGTTPQPEDMPEGADAKIGMAATIATLPFMAGGAAALKGGVAGLRGLSTADKARQVAGATGTLAKTGAVFYAAEKALEAAGVPPGARAAILAGMGVTRPGEAARDAIKGVFKPAEAAAVSGSERYAAKVAAAKAEEAARKAATAALSKGTAKPLTQAEVEAARVRPWEAPKPNWTGMGDEAAEEAATIAAAPPPAAPSVASYQDELRAANEARAARFAALDKERAVKEAMEPVKVEPMAASEARLYDAAEAKDARDQLKVANDYLKATEAAAKKAATQRAVGDGVKRSSVPKTDNVIEGDFIDPQHVSVVPEPPPMPTVPPNYEATAGQTTKVEEFRRRFGAERAAKKFGMTKDQVNQIRLDAGDRGAEALGEAAGIPEHFVGRIKATLAEMKARGASRDEVLAYIRKANNEKARWQVEGFARGMDLL